jgi:hypothetical protein
MEKLLVCFLLKARLVNMFIVDSCIKLNFFLMEQLMSSSAKNCIVQLVELSFYTNKNKFSWHLYYLISFFYIEQEPTKGTFSFFLSFGKYSLNGTFSVFLQKDTFNQNCAFSILFNYFGQITVNRMDIQKKLS